MNEIKFFLYPKSKRANQEVRTNNGGAKHTTGIGLKKFYFRDKIKSEVLNFIFQRAQRQQKVFQRNSNIHKAH